MKYIIIHVLPNTPTLSKLNINHYNHKYLLKIHNCTTKFDSSVSTL